LKRLLGLLGLTCLLVLTACFYLGETASFILGVGAFLLFLLSMLLPFARKEGTYPVAFMTAVITVCIFFGYTNFFVVPLQKFDGKTATVVAVQEDDYFSNGYYNYILKVKEIDSEKVNTKIRLCSKKALFTKAYDELRFKSEISFVENRSFWANETFLRTYLYEVSEVEVVKPTKRPLMYYIKELKNKFSTALYLEMNYDEAAFSSAVMLGDKYSMKPQTKDLLRASGLSHIAVVSGLHLSIVAAMAGKLFSRLFKNKIVCGILTILLIVAFAVMTGLAPPVLRAAVMLIILNIGNMINRRSDSINSIGIAALLLIIRNPYCVGDAGMLLSFAATLGIVFWSNKISRPIISKLSGISFFRISFINKTTRAIVNTFAMSLSAAIWTLPITMLTFGAVSTNSIFTNILVVPFMWFVLIIIALCIATHYVDFLAVMCDALSRIVSVFYDYMITVCEAFTYLPHSYVHTDKLYFYIWLSVSLILAAVALVVNKKRITVLSVMLSLIVIFTGSLNYNIARAKSLTLYVSDTGKGLSVILEGSDGYALLRASGNRNRNYVVENKIDQMYIHGSDVCVDVPGNNSDIFYDNVLNQFDYERILRYDNKEDKSDKFSSDSDNVTLFNDIHNLDLWSKAQIKLIPADEEVFEYITAGETEILIVPSGGDCTLIPPKCRVVDVIITEGIPDRYDLLECDTLYIKAEGYKADATREIMSSICNNYCVGTEFSFDINI